VLTKSFNTKLYTLGHQNLLVLSEMLALTSSRYPFFLSHSIEDVGRDIGSCSCKPEPRLNRARVKWAPLYKVNVCFYLGTSLGFC